MQFDTTVLKETASSIFKVGDETAGSSGTLVFTYQTKLHGVTFQVTIAFMKREVVM
jgi:hypothetical protein